MILLSSIGGSKVGARGNPGIQILSFSCSFRPKKMHFLRMRTIHCSDHGGGGLALPGGA